MTEKTQRATVPVEDIHPDERCQARATIDHDVIAEYADAYRAKTKLPPLDVYRVAGKLMLVDGYHRFAALRVAGETFARVEVVGDGSIDDAVWYATSVNAQHGLRRSNADKRRAVEIALKSAIGSEQSSATIAEHVGVSRDFVSRVRAEAERVAESQRKAGDVSSDDTSPKTRTDKLGRQQPARKPRQVRTDDTPEAPPTRIEYDEDAPPDVAPLPFEPEYSEPDAKPLPAHGAALVAAADEVKAARKRVMARATEEASHAWQRAELLMRQAESALRLSEPVTCPHCVGLGCVRCEERGWRTRTEVGK